jgi:hypothetical protein
VAFLPPRFGPCRESRALQAGPFNIMTNNDKSRFLQQGPFQMDKTTITLVNGLLLRFLPSRTQREIAWGIVIAAALLTFLALAGLRYRAAGGIIDG